MKMISGWIAVAVFGLFSHVNAQVKNTKIDEVKESVTFGGPTVVINPRNPLNVVAATAPDNVYISNDGGSTWQKQKIKSSYGFFGTPAIVCDGKGAFYLIHSSNSSGKGLESESTMEVLVCQISYDGGKTWDDGTAFGYAPPKDLFSPSASIDPKGNLSVVWTQSDKYGSKESGCRSVVMISSSPNGKKWSRPVELSQVPGNCANGDSTILGASVGSGDKRIYAAWNHDNKILIDRSFDAGGMWLSNDITVENNVHGWKMDTPDQDIYNGLPDLKIDITKSERRGLMYMSWAAKRTGSSDADIWFIRSHNFGDIWTQPRRVNSDTTANHQYNPVMAFDNMTGFVYILYFDRSQADGKTDVHLAYSRTSGNTFSSIKVSEQPFSARSPYAGSLLSLTAHNGNIIPVWIRYDGDTASLLTASIKEITLPK